MLAVTNYLHWFRHTRRGKEINTSVKRTEEIVSPKTSPHKGLPLMALVQKDLQSAYKIT
jgi:hypothetical protein